VLKDNELPLLLPLLIESPQPLMIMSLYLIHFIIGLAFLFEYLYLRLQSLFFLQQFIVNVLFFIQLLLDPIISWLIRLYLSVQFINFVDEGEMQCLGILDILDFSNRFQIGEASVGECGLWSPEVFFYFGRRLQSYYLFRTHPIICINLFRRGTFITKYFSCVMIWHICRSLQKELSTS
jgi:hypothetical protein